MDWKEILEHTSYADKTPCILKFFTANNVRTLNDVQNAPGRLGHICGVDIYKLVDEINKIFLHGIPVAEEDLLEEVEDTDLMAVDDTTLLATALVDVEEQGE